MKKSGLLLLALLISLSALFGCSADKGKSAENNLSENIQQENSKPDLPIPDTFIDCQTLIGEDITAYNVDISDWDFEVLHPVGTSTFYNNEGTVKVNVGWDEKTITRVFFTANTENESITGMPAIKDALQEKYGEPREYDNDYIYTLGDSGYELTLSYRRAYITWNKEKKEEFEKSGYELHLPLESTDLIDCQKYIGKKISNIYLSDTLRRSWEASGCDHLIAGDCSLYGNNGYAWFSTGLDNNTITTIRFELDEGESIEPDEFISISNELEKIFGEPTDVYEDINVYTKDECRFQFDGRNIESTAAMLRWTGENYDAFLDSILNPPVEPYEPKKAPAIGMTAEEVRQSKWGEPKEINKTTTAYSVTEQWVYSDNRYIYLRDGIVTAIQE